MPRRADETQLEALRQTTESGNPRRHLAGRKNDARRNFAQYPQEALTLVVRRL